MSHAILPPTNGIPVGLFGESSRAGNQSEKEPSALSHFLSCISESTAWKAITRLKEACISRLNPNSNLSTSDVNVSFADLRIRYPDLAIITPCLSHGRVVVSAVKSGHYDILEGLLRNDTISIEDRGTAVVKAAENDRDQVIDTLLRNGPISIEDRGRAVVKASSLDGPNTLRIIEMLLENGAQISEDNRGEAVINAARNGHVDIVETLLQNGPISDWYREWAVINAARTGHVDVIEMLLRNGSIREDYRGEAVMKAAGNGNVQVIDTLLQSGPISEDHRGRAVMKAARFGHVQVIDTLLRNGPISIQDRGWAVVYAAQCQNPYLIQGTIERLLQNGQISDMHRGSAVVHVATRGHVDVIEMLLLNGQINDEDRRSAVLNAAQNGHFRIIDRLLEGGARIPRNARNEAVGIDVPSRYFHVPTWEDLENNPLGYLKSFVEIGPSPILFGNGRAVDLGGVTKDFVTRLVNSLKEKKLICADDELGFGDWVSLPVAKNKEQEEALGLFGRLLTHLYMRNCDRRDKIMIPKILDPHLFAVMLAGEGNELVTLDSSEKLQDIWKNPSTASDDLISFVKAGVDFEGENKPFMHAFCEWKASVQKGLRLLKAGIGHPLTAAMETQEGCRTLKNEFFGREITAQLVMENLNIRQPKQFVETYTQMVEWLKAWINKASIDQLEKFLHCVTGHKSLNMGKIRIKQNNRRGELAQALEIHTCSNSLALPRVENMDEASFIQALEASLEQKSYNVD